MLANAGTKLAADGTLLLGRLMITTREAQYTIEVPYKCNNKWVLR